MIIVDEYTTNLNSLSDFPVVFVLKEQEFWSSISLIIKITFAPSNWPQNYLITFEFKKILVKRMEVKISIDVGKYPLKEEM